MKLWQERTVRPGVSLSCSAEQAAGASMTLAASTFSASKKRRVGEGYPWMISKFCQRVTISAAAVGLVVKGKKTTKKWTFEVNHALLCLVLRHYAEHPAEALMPVTGLRGVQGAGAKATEEYPLFLGALLSAAVSFKGPVVVIRKRKRA